MKEKIKNRNGEDWNKRCGSQSGDLFWADQSRYSIITIYGIRSAFTVSEIIEIEVNQ